MRNRILHLTRNTIPYVKELQPLAGSVAGCILMQQLDYWFERHSEGFWKFLEPSNHARYKAGDSWTEELGMTPDEFRTAFDRIGIRYKSKGIFDATKDKFQKKFYCSYLDRRENLTYYFRNHLLVDEALDALISRDQQSVYVNQESRFTGNLESRFAGDRETSSLEIRNHDLLEIVKPNIMYTENTNTENTQIPLLPLKIQTGSGSSESLIFPKQLSDQETSTIANLIKHLPFSTQQELLDELQGAIKRQGTIKRSPIAFLKGLVDKEKKGLFTLDLGVAIQNNREKKQAEKTETKNVILGKSAHYTEDPAASEKGKQILAKSKHGTWSHFGHAAHSNL